MAAKTQAKAPRKAVGKPALAAPPAPRPFTVFLDRDGVFNVNPSVGIRLYRNLEWLPGARQAFARLNRPHIHTSLATNQPWVGLLTCTPGMMHRLHARFKAELESHGGRLDNIEIAMAPPFIGHRRNKPRPGMLEDGAVALVKQGHAFDKSRAVMVGDKVKDAQAAAAFGIPCILLATTYAAGSLEESARKAGVPYLAIAPDLDGAVDLILALAGEGGDD
jgi:D-glycero-D-manno-heptose 1,7-bisphosphate phosphatase